MIELTKIYNFLTSSKFYLPIIYILAGIIAYYIISNSIIKINRNNPINKKSKGYDKRKNTVISLVNNIIKYIIAIIIIIMILNVYNINTTNIIASLGIASVIIGLAFQDIIKDLLAGIFIVFDNAYAVGDIVKINDFTGEVISFGLKTTKIKSYTGEVKIISNSSFNEVINYNFNKTKLLLNIPVSYKTDIKKIEEILSNIKEEVLKINNVNNMSLLGIDQFAESSIIYIVEIECNPYTHIGVKRQVLKVIKETFDKNKIEIPYNQLDVHIEK